MRRHGFFSSFCACVYICLNNERRNIRDFRNLSVLFDRTGDEREESLGNVANIEIQTLLLILMFGAEQKSRNHRHIRGLAQQGRGNETWLEGRAD